MKDLFETIELIKAQIKSVAGIQLVSLENAKGRVLAENLTALKNLPAFDNSALDGYAFKFSDKDSPLDIKGTIFAGDKNDYIVQKNECYKIMTGAKIPQNADTILRVEDATLENGKLLIKTPIKQNDGHRIKGEELKIGENLLKKGQILSAADIMVLASQGIYKVKVTRKIRVGIFSSGNELYEPWQKADDNSIYNANALAINALFSSSLCEVSYLGIIKDDLQTTKEALGGNSHFDLLITSGGASVGDADFMDEALNDIGFEALFKGIIIRPAKPTKLYKKGQNLVFILPGNPLSAFLSCFLVGKTLLHLLSGVDFEFDFIDAEFKGDFTIKNGRNNLILGNLQNGAFVVDKNLGMMKPFKSKYLLISDFSKSEFKDKERVKLLKILDF